MYQGHVGSHLFINARLSISLCYFCSQIHVHRMEPNMKRTKISKGYPSFSKSSLFLELPTELLTSIAANVARMILSILLASVRRVLNVVVYAATVQF